MTRYSKFLTVAAVLVVSLTIFMIAGCSNDGPVGPASVSENGDPAGPPDPDQALWDTVLGMEDLWGADDEVEYNTGVTRLPFPDSPEKLMANFQTIYETMQVYDYLRTMHPDFLTILQQETTDEFPDVGTTLSRYEEQNVHKRMFSTQAVTDPQGNLVPGVQAIVFDVFQQMAPWETTDPDGLFPDAFWAPYQVSILWDRGQNFSTMRVEGVINFYVVSRDFEYKDEAGQFFQMIGQLDLTNIGKATEGTSWGTVKALFR